MGLLSLEHGKRAYAADFALYAVAAASLAGWLVFGAPKGHGLAIVCDVTLGVAAWTLIEYVVHRYVLHGLQPFKRWHAEHHLRPRALICSPTIVTAPLFVLLVFLPVLWLCGIWQGSALSLGLLAGYLAYGLIHHATHHWQMPGAWLAQRKRWHALHHHLAQPVCFGVTSSFWDLVFGSGHNVGRRIVKD